MTASLNLFDQFMSPILLGLPLIIISLMFPMLLFSFFMFYWVNTRFQALQTWLSHNFIKQLMSPLNTKGYQWTIMFISMMMLLISINLLGLLPYSFTPTTQLSMNLALASPLWLATVLKGVWDKPNETMGHLLPEGTPTLLIPMLIVVETISMLIRPMTLAIRLTANLTAGHLLIQLLSSTTMFILSVIPSTALLTMIVSLLLTTLEIAVAMIQAFVFVLLLSLYLQENT